MVNASEIGGRFEVVGSDGHHVGRVDQVVGDAIGLAKLDLAGGFRRHLIPLDWARRVEGKRVILSITTDEAKSRWTEEAVS